MSAFAGKADMKKGQSMSAPPQWSDIHLFGNGESIINLDTKITSGAFYLAMSKQELHRSQIARAPVDQGRLGSS
jgi:hypothetical protein